MPLAGEQLTFKEALALCSVVGWERDQLDVAVALMCAESGRYTEAYHINADGSTDRGLYQINDKAHPGVTDRMAFDPKENATYAWELSKSGTDYSPWMAYTSGSYEQFVDDVRAVRVQRTWRSRQKLWE